MEITCPVCNNGNIVENDRVFSCSNASYNSETKMNEGCEFVIWKNNRGSILAMEDIEKLIAGETIEKTDLVSQAGKEYTGLLTYDVPSGKINLTFNQSSGDFNETTDDNGIVDFSKGYKKDGVVVWKKVAGSEITYDEAIMLFNGEKVKKDDLVSREGKPFEATLALNSEGKVEFV